jgi:Ca2+-dependent lipid-binding protein
MIITLVEAKGLAAADKGGTSDPYCTLELEKLGKQDVQKFRSRTEHKTLDPAWGQAFKFTLGTYEQVFKHDGVSLKDAATNMLSMVHREDVFKDIAQKGVAALAAVADETHEKDEENKKMLGDAQAPAILLINVLKAKNLMSADSGGTSDPYVRIHVGIEIANGKKTKVIKKTLNPEWNEHFEIQIREKQRKDMITIEVFDKDVIGKDDSLGKISIALETLALKYTPSEELLTKWHAFDAEEGILNNGQVLLSYDLVKRSSGQTAVSKKKADLFRTITLNIWDYDMGGFGTDDFLGQLKLPLNLLEPDKTCDKWFDLEPRLGCKGRALPVTGQVHLRIMCRFKNREMDRTMPAKPAQVLLQLQRVRALKETRPTELAVTLVSAKNLHLRLDTDEKPDSMAVVSVDGRKFASDVVKCEQNPGWYSSLSFDTIRLESKLHVALFDIMGKQRRFLGKVEYDSSKLKIGELREETLKLRKGFREPEDNSASPYKDLQVIVHLREAKDLLAADRGGTSDPYATLQIDNQEYKSKVQRKTLKPKWRETFRLQLGSYPKSRSEETTAKNRKLWKKARKKKMGVDTSVTMTRPGSAQTNKTTNTMVTSFSEILKGVKKYLTVSIWDHDMGPNPDDFLGCVVLPMDLVTDGDEFEDWFELRPGEDKAQVTGMVKLGIKITEKWDPEPVEGSVTLRFERIPKDVTKEEIVIEVVQARDIQAADRGGTSDPFAIVSFEGPGIVNASTVKTRVIPKTLTPVWEELFVLSKERGAKNLVVDVFDYDRFGSNDFLGRVFLPITTITEDYTEQWLELVEKTGDRPSTGEITGQVQLKFKRRPQGSVMPEEIDLHVIEAMNLMAADRGGTSDPFAVIRLKGSSRMPNTFKTRVVSKNLNPVWNERFTLNVQESDKSLILDVFDEDILGSNDFLGRIKLPLSDIVNGQPVQAWYPLSSMNEELLEESEELVIEVIEAKGIKAADRGGTSDPFAILSFNGGSKRLSSQKTKTIHKTLEPVWNESFTTSLDSHPHELCVDIFDYDLVGMNDFLGRVKVSINLIQHNSTVQQWFELGYKNDPNNKEVGLGDGRSRGGKEQTSKTLASAATAVTCLPENSDGNEPSDNDESQVNSHNAIVHHHIICERYTSKFSPTDSACVCCRSRLRIRTF